MDNVNISDAIVVFHYNKQHNIDSSVPPWILKAKGQTYYVNHVNIANTCGFSTKETPDNPHTKGALKMRGELRIVTHDDGQIEGFIS